MEVSGLMWATKQDPTERWGAVPEWNHQVVEAERDEVWRERFEVRGATSPPLLMGSDQGVLAVVIRGDV